MQTNWNDCLDFTLNVEGGYESDPDDPGCWTGNAIGSGSLIGSNLGISASTLAAWYSGQSSSQLQQLMIALTDEQAGAIYQSGYWTPIQGDSLPSGIDLMLWDDAVNRGVGVAVKTAQGIVGATQDGILGPETLAYISSAPSISSLAMQLGATQAQAYIGGSQWSQFGLGWSRRWGARMQAAMSLLNAT